jgi:hypothetical protein
MLYFPLIYYKPHFPVEVYQQVKDLAQQLIFGTLPEETTERTERSIGSVIDAAIAKVEEVRM